MKQLSGAIVIPLFLLLSFLLLGAAPSAPLNSPVWISPSSFEPPTLPGDSAPLRLRFSEERQLIARWHNYYDHKFCHPHSHEARNQYAYRVVGNGVEWHYPDYPYPDKVVFGNNPIDMGNGTSLYFTPDGVVSNKLEFYHPGRKYIVWAEGILSHASYFSVWTGGARYWREGNNYAAEVCVVDGFSISCYTYRVDQPVPDGKRLVGNPLGNVFIMNTTCRESVGTLTIVAKQVEGKDMVRSIVPPDGYFCVYADCGWGGGWYSVLSLANNGVPAAGFGHMPSNNVVFGVGPNSVISGTNSDNFSCAGPVVSLSGNPIFPPACGYREGNQKSVSFGNWEPLGSIRFFTDSNKMRDIRSYEQPNRTMVFEYAGVVRSGRAVTFFFDPQNPVSSPLTITVPSLRVVPATLSVEGSRIYVARTDTGAVARAEVAQGSPTTLVVSPEVVQQVAASGGKLVVRAVAAARAGTDHCREVGFSEQIWNTQCIHVATGTTKYTTFPSPQSWSAIGSGVSWFVPQALVVGITKSVRDEAYDQEVYQAYCYSHVGDVAQAEVRFIPVQARLLVPSGAVWIAIGPHPDHFPQTGQYWVSSGNPVRVTMDIPLRGVVEFAEGIQMVVTYTLPSGQQVVTTIVPSQVYVQGGLHMPSSAGGVYFGDVDCPKTRCTSSSFSQPLTSSRSFEMTWGYNGEKKGCFRYNDTRCVECCQPGSGEPRVEARFRFVGQGTVSYCVGGQCQPITVTAYGPWQDYVWPLLFYQETR